MTFHARKFTLWLTLIACLFFAALGVVVRPALPLEGALLCVLMLAGAGAAGMALYQGRPLVQLSTDGFALQSLFGTRSVRWAQIERMEITRIRHHDVLCIHYHAVVPGGHGATRLKRCALNDMYDAPLPGIQATLQAWQRMYGGQR